MSTSIQKVENAIKKSKQFLPKNDVLGFIKPLNDREIVTIGSMPLTHPYSEEGVRERLNILSYRTQTALPYLQGEEKFQDPEMLKGLVEDYIGMVGLPVGISGPLVVNGAHGKGDYMIPLATTDGSVIACYNRGMKACRLSGGISSVCLVQGVQRCPLFQFETISEATHFVLWVLDRIDVLELVVEEASDHADLIDVKANLEGNTVILTFEYETGDAAGHRMVSRCTKAVCCHIVNAYQQKIKHWYLDANYAGDKKATAASFGSVRGKKVSAEVVVKKHIIDKVLKTTVDKMVQYWKSSTLGSIQSGSLGNQGQYAEGLTALFIATGQNVSSVPESAVGITRMEKTSHGDLYVSVTLPSLMIGTVGGGTTLPVQRECLEMMGCVGTGSSKKLAEIAAALCLAGEVSIAAALSEGDFYSY